jgi:PAS domain S-box-containing protein
MTLASLSPVHAERLTHRHADGTEHLVQFYEDEHYLASVVGQFVGHGLAACESAVIIATPEHRRAFTEELAARGHDVEAAQASGRLVLVDARECLGRFMVGTKPDPSRFVETIEQRIRAARAQSEHARVRAYGEMVDLLWRDGNSDGALLLEELWNELGRRHSFTLLCAYVMGNFLKSEDAIAFAEVCRTHSDVFPTERYASVAGSREQLFDLALLEQRARALESEIEHRKSLEAGLRSALMERQKVETALRESREELADFLEQAAEGIHAVGPDGIIIWANRAELELTGYARSEYIGHHIAEFHADPAVLADILTRLSRNETLHDQEAQLRCKDGSIKDVLINSNVARRDGAFLHTRCFTRDVTDRKRLHEELKRRNETLAKEMHFSDLFIGVLGHDLRNPLSAVMNTAVFLARSADPEVVTRAKRMLNSAARMGRMIDQLLDFTRVRVGGGFALERHPGRLDATSRQVLEELSADREVEVDFHATGDCSGEWDDDRIAQLVSNLLGNAFAHGQPGHHVVLRVDGSEADSVLLEVGNRGHIPDDVRPTLFEPLKLGAKRAGSSGLGLGLFISQQIALAHGGTLQVRSGPEDHTVFSLRLPRRVDTGGGVP